MTGDGAAASLTIAGNHKTYDPTFISFIGTHEAATVDIYRAQAA